MNTNLKKQKEGYYEQASKQEKEKNSDVETYAIQFFIDHCIRSLCVFCLSVGNSLLVHIKKIKQIQSWQKLRMWMKKMMDF